MNIYLYKGIETIKFGFNLFNDQRLYAQFYQNKIRLIRRKW